MKYFFIIYLLFAFSIISYPQSLPDDYILPLPKDLDTGKVSSDDLNKAIERLHNFSEYIYNPIKITALDSILYIPKNLTDLGNNNRWGEGVWGRGPFSKFVDRFLFDGIQKTAYSSFYKEHHSNNLNHYFWGTHPIISYCSRTLIAYCNIYTQTSNHISKSFCIDRIIAGAKYLISQQQEDGSYVQWHWRKDKNIPNIDDEIGINERNSYATANAIAALTTVYILIKRIQINHESLSREIYLAIDKAGLFLARNTNTHAHKNYVAFSIWGLVHAYKIIKNDVFIDSAITKYKTSINFSQDSNGAWFLEKSNNSDYHDAHPAYMGIILRALIELYDILPNPFYYDIRNDLRKSITKGINHFLLPGIVHSNFPGNKVRLNKDGGLFAYFNEKEYIRSKSRALQLSEALMLALQSPDLFSTESDIKRINGFLNAAMKYQINETCNTRTVLHVNSDIYFKTLTLFLLISDNAF